jgi:hypothetical protein
MVQPSTAFLSTSSQYRNPHMSTASYLNAKTMQDLLANKLTTHPWQKQSFR